MLNKKSNPLESEPQVPALYCITCYLIICLTATLPGDIFHSVESDIAGNYPVTPELPIYNYHIQEALTLSVVRLQKSPVYSLKFNLKFEIIINVLFSSFRFI